MQNQLESIAPATYSAPTENGRPVIFEHAGTRRVSRLLGSAGAQLAYLGARGVIYAGLAICAMGFAVLAFTWGRVAGLLDVSLQMPYVISGGFTGLGLVIVGMTVVHAGIKQADAVRRMRQLEQLAIAIREIRAAFEGEEASKEAHR